MKYDYLIVGAGLTGLVLGERLTAQSGKKVLIGIISEILINRWVLYNHKNLKNINYMSNILVSQ